MSKTSGLTVKGRIWGGFLSIITFLVIVAGVGMWGASTVSDSVDDFARVVNNTMTIQSIDADVGQMRRNVIGYVYTGNDAQAAAVKTLQERLRKSLAASVAAVQNPETKANLQRMQALFESYSANFAKVVDLREKRDQLVSERMNPLGLKARQQLSDVIDAATAAREFELAASVGKTQEKLLLMRLTAVRFLSTPDKALVDEVAKLGEQVAAESRGDLALARDAQTRKAIEVAVASVAEYEKAFEETAAAILERNNLANVVMAKEAEEFAALAEKASKAQSDLMAEIETDTRGAVSAQQTTGSVVSVIAIAAGLAFAFLIARAILVPVNSMTSAMGDLAGGKLDVDIPALDRADEIGLMAQAVQVFKRNAIDKVR
ncbi:MAG: HAMP domain-containing protein, partial [Pseudomonadota bacterium]